MLSPEYFKSPFIDLANQTTTWWPGGGDYKDIYQRHLFHRHNELKENGWVNYEPFTYKFNSHGFRCDEFTNDDSILFLGCSLTAGIGLPLEHLWATKVANHLNLKCYNLGMPGHSNDIAFRLGYHWIPIIKPKIVIFCTIEISRLELYHNNYFQNLSPGSPSQVKDYYKFFTLWNETDVNATLSKEKTVLSLNHICNSNNVRFLSFDSADPDFMQYGIDYARDLSHPGIKSNQRTADNIINTLL